MAALKESSLPNVLKEYLPEYEPQSPRRTTTTNTKQHRGRQAQPPPPPSQRGAQLQLQGAKDTDNSTGHQHRDGGAGNTSTDDDTGRHVEEPDQPTHHQHHHHHHHHHHQQQQQQQQQQQHSNAQQDAPHQNKARDKRGLSLHGKPSASAREGVLRPLTREKTSDLLRRQEAQKYERNFETWQQIKEDVKEEHKKRLRSKVALQQELIRAQDELYVEKQRQRDDEAAKKREAERTAKQAKADAVRQLCKEAGSGHGGGDDAQQKGSRSKSLRQANVSEDDVSPTTPPPPVVETVTVAVPRRRVPQEVYVSDVATAPSHHRQHSGGQLSSLTSAGTETTIPSDGQENSELFADIKEEGEEDGVVVVKETKRDEDDDDELDLAEDTPWHHAQMYQLFGKDADYFLHPKIEQEKKAVVKPLNPKMRRVGGRAGAGSLWTVLRNESKMRLLNEDEKLITPELKSAYGAFVRQCLAKRKHPVKRNYYSAEDVPDMERLMDQSQVYGAQDYRHRVELMFRSSHTNADRTRILLFNNPIPNINSRDGEESVRRFVAPDDGDDHWDAVSEMSYKKWVKTKLPPITDSEDATGHQVDDVVGRGRVALEEEDDDYQYDADADGNVWNFMTADIPTERKRQPRHQEKLPKYQFLTEEDATVPGQFSRRRKELMDARTRPQAYEGEQQHRRPGQKSLSAMAQLGPSRLPNSSGSSKATSGVKSQKTRRSLSEASHRRQHRSEWQPLSLNALVEYSDKHLAGGQGDFNQGRASMWNTQTA